MYLRMTINKETYEMLFMELIEKDEERYLVLNLCNLMDEHNKIKYVNLKQLANKLNIKGTCRLSTKLVKLEKLDIIKREYGYVTINKRYASKVTDDKQIKPIKNNNMDSKYVITVSKLKK